MQGQNRRILIEWNDPPCPVEWLSRGLQVFPKRRKSRTTDSEHPFPRYPNLVRGLEVVRPAQVWVSDITYICLPRDFVYLAVIMDVFTRSIRG